MKSIVSSRRYSATRIAVVSAIILVVLAGAISAVVMMNRNASAIQYGNTGTGGPPSGMGGSGAPYTWHGNGWKLFDRASGGPTGGFKSGSWGAIQSACTDYDQVWVHLILGQNGNEVGYSFEPSPGQPGRAVWGGDAYAFYGNGTKRPGSPSSWPDAGSGEAIGIVTGVYNGFIAQGGPSGQWMAGQIGWFCWGEAKPWTVTPTVSAPATAEVGDTISWYHRIQNDGEGKLTTNVSWAAENSGSGWPNTNQGSWVLGQNTPRLGAAAVNTTYTVQPSDFGKQLCRRTVAQPRSKSDGSQIASSSACVAIVKKPKIQVRGGDLNVGRATGANAGATSNIVSSISRGTNGTYYGSWTEYGITASGSVNGVSSGANLAGGAPSTAMTSLSSLTFANTGACIGCYTQGSGAPDVPTRFLVGGTTPDLPLNAANSVNINAASPALQGLYKYTGTGTIRITASGQVPAGKQVIINAKDASVIIDSNIQYTTGTLNNISAIPQVVIIARNITVAESVGRIDSWLVTTGTGNAGYINTCSRVTPNAPTNATLNGGTCTAQLVVTGPVITNKLYLYRTAGAVGSNEAVGTPAEVFNLRADAYIWGSSYAPGTGRLPTVTTTEVPPRF